MRLFLDDALRLGFPVFVFRRRETERFGRFVLRKRDVERLLRLRTRPIILALRF